MRVTKSPELPFMARVSLSNSEVPRLLGLFVCILCVSHVLHLKNAFAQPCKNEAEVIFESSILPEYDFGLNTSDGLVNWVSHKDDYIRVVYPSGQDWGVVFITVGTPTDVDSLRSVKDLSLCEKLSLELRGVQGGESIEIGIKDRTDPNNGTETRIPVSNLSRDWKTYEFPVLDFITADLEYLYVVVEFVFGYDAATVDFRNVKFFSSSYGNSAR